MLVSAGYLDATLDTQNAVNNGNQLVLTPKFSGSVWSSYRLPLNLTLGGGLRFTDDVFINAAGAQTVTHRSGTNTVNSLSILGDDMLAVTGGSLTVANNFSAGASTSISAGTLTLNGASTMASLALSGGVLGGTGSLVVGGASSWLAGNQTGTGTTRYDGALSLSGLGAKVLSGGRTVTLNGTTTWSGNTAANNGALQFSGGTLNNAGKVVINTRNYKIVVVMPYGQGLANATSTGSLEVIAVDMPNVTGISTAAWTTYRTTVDKIEAASGYNFLDKLPDSIETYWESR